MRSSAANEVVQVVNGDSQETRMGGTAGSLNRSAGGSACSGEAHRPPDRRHLFSSAEIEATLKRACYDCHSNETRWPWYSCVAPLSWLVVHDVTLGRKEVNFSEWGSYYPATKRRKLEWMGRTLREEAMPPWTYRLLHPDARLTNAERAAVERWIESQIAAIQVQK